MLDPEQVELADLALALEDHSEEHRWWLDADTGAVEPHFAGDPEAAQFVEIEGRRAFRRFKDALLDYPELRRAWFQFHDARSERRAIEWLLGNELVDADAAEEAIARRPEPTLPEVPELLDAEGVAQRAAQDLKRLYRDRLRGVLLLGPWARGDAHPEPELELLIVLDSVDDRWEERRRMDKVMWRHSIRNNAVVTAVPVSQAELDGGGTPPPSPALPEGVPGGLNTGCPL